MGNSSGYNAFTQFCITFAPTPAGLAWFETWNAAKAEPYNRPDWGQFPKLPTWNQDDADDGDELARNHDPRELTVTIKKDRVTIYNDNDVNVEGLACLLQNYLILFEPERELRFTWATGADVYDEADAYSGGAVLVTAKGSYIYNTQMLFQLIAAEQEWPIDFTPWNGENGCMTYYSHYIADAAKAREKF